MLIVLIGILLLCLIQYGSFTVTGKPLLDFLIVAGAINFSLYVWLRIYSQYSISRQSAIAVAILLGQFTAYSLFRLDGFDGNGRFIPKWRWTATPEQIYSNFSETVLGRPADLSNVSNLDSPAFRGWHRNGVYQPDAKVDWQSGVREIWRRPVGRGWSSFATANGFAVTQEQINDEECVSCYQLSSGKLVWRCGVPTRFDEITSGPGPRATPAIFGGKVFALGATGILCCINGADGSIVWKKNLCEKEKDRVLFGYSCSPLLHDNRLWVALGSPNPSLACLDTNSGNLLWTSGNRKAGYSSPQLLFENDKQHSVLLFDATGLHSHNYENGELRWTYLWGDNSDEQVNVTQPVVTKNHRVLISSGYGRGTALLQLGSDQQVSEIWQTKRLKSKFSSIVVAKDHAFGLDEGILTCIDLESGRRVWKRGRYGHGQLIQFGDCLIVQTESGDCVVVEINTKEFVEVRRFRALTDRTWNHPVVSGQYLLTRNDREAVCFELPIDQTQSAKK